jgi:hypothetical protein
MQLNLIIAIIAFGVSFNINSFDCTLVLAFLARYSNLQYVPHISNGVEGPETVLEWYLALFEREEFHGATTLECPDCSQSRLRPITAINYRLGGSRNLIDSGEELFSRNIMKSSRIECNAPYGRADNTWCTGVISISIPRPLVYSLS